MHANNRIPTLSFLDATQMLSQNIKKPLPYNKVMVGISHTVTHNMEVVFNSKFLKFENMNYSI